MDYNLEEKSAHQIIRNLDIRVLKKGAIFSCELRNGALPSNPFGWVLNLELATRGVLTLLWALVLSGGFSF